MGSTPLACFYSTRLFVRLKEAKPEEKKRVKGTKTFKESVQNYIIENKNDNLNVTSLLNCSDNLHLILNLSVAYRRYDHIYLLDCFHQVLMIIQIPLQ